MEFKYPVSTYTDSSLEKDGYLLFGNVYPATEDFKSAMTSILDWLKKAIGFFTKGEGALKAKRLIWEKALTGSMDTWDKVKKENPSLAYSYKVEKPNTIFNQKGLSETKKNLETTTKFITEYTNLINQVKSKIGEMPAVSSEADIEKLSTFGAGFDTAVREAYTKMKEMQPNTFKEMVDVTNLKILKPNTVESIKKEMDSWYVPEGGNLTVNAGYIDTFFETCVAEKTSYAGTSKLNSGNIKALDDIYKKISESTKTAAGASGSNKELTKKIGKAYSSIMKTARALGNPGQYYLSSSMSITSSLDKHLKVVDKAMTGKKSDEKKGENKEATDNAEQKTEQQEQGKESMYVPTFDYDDQLIAALEYKFDKLEQSIDFNLQAGMEDDDSSSDDYSGIGGFFRRIWDYICKFFKWIGSWFSGDDDKKSDEKKSKKIKELMEKLKPVVEKMTTEIDIPKICEDEKNSKEVEKNGKKIKISPNTRILTVGSAKNYSTALMSFAGGLSALMNSIKAFFESDTFKKVANAFSSDEAAKKVTDADFDAFLKEMKDKGIWFNPGDPTSMISVIAKNMNVDLTQMLKGKVGVKKVSPSDFFNAWIKVNNITFTQKISPKDFMKVCEEITSETLAEREKAYEAFSPTEKICDDLFKSFSTFNKAYTTKATKTFANDSRKNISSHFKEVKTAVMDMRLFVQTVAALKKRMVKFFSGFEDTQVKVLEYLDSTEKEGKDDKKKEENTSENNNNNNSNGGNTLPTLGLNLTSGKESFSSLIIEDGTFEIDWRFTDKVRDLSRHIQDLIFFEMDSFIVDESVGLLSNFVRSIQVDMEIAMMERVKTLKQMYPRLKGRDYLPAINKFVADTKDHMETIYSIANRTKRYADKMNYASDEFSYLDNDTSWVSDIGKKVYEILDEQIEESTVDNNSDIVEPEINGKEVHDDSGEIVINNVDDNTKVIVIEGTDEYIQFSAALAAFKFTATHASAGQEGFFDSAMKLLTGLTNMFSRLFSTFKMVYRSFQGLKRTEIHSFQEKFAGTLMRVKRQAFSDLATLQVPYPHKLDTTYLDVTEKILLCLKACDMVNRSKSFVITAKNLEKQLREGISTAVTVGSLYSNNSEVEKINKLYADASKCFSGKTSGTTKEFSALFNSTEEFNTCWKLIDDGSQYEYDITPVYSNLEACNEHLKHAVDVAKDKKKTDDLAISKEELIGLSDACMFMAKTFDVYGLSLQDFNRLEHGICEIAKSIQRSKKL